MKVYSNEINAAEKDVTTVRDYLLNKGINFVESPDVEFNDGKRGRAFFWYSFEQENAREIMRIIGGTYTFDGKEQEA